MGSAPLKADARAKESVCISGITQVLSPLGFFPPLFKTSAAEGGRNFLADLDPGVLSPLV